MKVPLALGFGIGLMVVGGVLGAQRVRELTAQPLVVPMVAVQNLPADLPATNGYLAGHPSRIVVPSVGIDVPVADGIYNTKTQTWNVGETVAQYAVITPEANTREGNTFIYGHNRPVVFQRLLDIKNGATATVYTSNGHQFTYTYTSVKVTQPTDASLFTYRGKPELTLQTCSGFWFQNRSLFTFSLTEAH